eukprot:gene1653-16120_t
MDEQTWNVFSTQNAYAQEDADEADEFEGTDMLLDDRYESEIVSKRFQEGGRLTFASPRSPNSPQGEFEYNSGYDDDARNHSMSEVDSVMSIPPNDLLVKFDILHHRVAQQGKKKFVLYTIVIMEVPKLDTDQAIIERRYSDFNNLHKGVRKECPNALKDVAFPKKELFGNYDNTLLETRGRKFEKYLRYIFHQQGVRASNAFKEFFYLRHLKLGTAYLRSEDYPESFEEFKTGLHLQKKLQDAEIEIVATLCALTEICKRQHKFVEAEQYASQGLELLQYDINSIYLLPLMKIAIDLRIKLRMDLTGLREKLRNVESKTSFDFDSQITLRELAVKRF